MQRIYLEIENPGNPVAEVVVYDDGVNVSYGNWSHQDWDAQFMPTRGEFVSFDEEPLLAGMYGQAWSLENLYALVHTCMDEQHDDIQIENE